MATLPHAPCPACAAASPGRFCPDCGQRQPRPGDFGLRAWAGEAWDALTDTDSRIWRTVRDLPRPGRLTLDHLAYRWDRHLPPLRLYLILSGIYFLLAWDVYFALGARQVLSAPPGAVPPAILALYADPLAADRLSDLTALSKFLFVLWLAAGVALLELGRRRPFGAHLVFAMHYTAFDFALFSLAAPLLAWVPGIPLAAVTLAGMVLLGLWLVVGIHRVYGRGWLASTWRGLFLLALDIVLSSLAGQLATAWLLMAAQD